MSGARKPKLQVAVDSRVSAAERALAAAALYEPTVAGTVLDLLDPTELHDAQARAAWGGMGQTWHESQHVSELALLATVMTPDELAPIKAMRDAARGRDPLELVRDVRAIHAVERIAGLCARQAERAVEQSTETSALRGWATDLAHALEAAVEQVVDRQRLPNARDAFRAWCDAHANPHRAWQAYWGIPELDDRLSGIQPGTLHVPIGLPAHGKSALACTAADASARRGKRVLYVSREMGVAEMGARFAAIATNQTHRQMQDAIREGADMSNVERHIPERIVPDCRSRDLASVRSTLRTAAAQGDPFHLVILDYLQLFNGPGDGDVERLSRIAYGAKDMAMDLDVGVIALAQVNRSNQGDQIPTMRQIRGASAIEDAADSVVAIFRGKEIKRLMDGAWAYDYMVKIEKARNAESGELGPHNLGAGTFRVFESPVTATEKVR